jgi:hypothetical protein
MRLLEGGQLAAALNGAKGSCPLPGDCAVESPVDQVFGGGPGRVRESSDCS